ncbi:MAG: hypothetical protein JNL21_11035 [Myxococcales bacterium]|nr:hypothetical protein [Myxococcales bacterium]
MLKESTSISTGSDLVTDSPPGPLTQGEGGRFEGETAALLRHNRVYLTAGATPYLLGLGFALAAAITGTAPLLIPVPHTIIFGTLALAYALRTNKDPVRLPGAIVVTETEVRRGGELVAKREDLVDGVLVPEAGRMRIRVRRKGVRLPLLFEVANEDEGRSLLRALGFDVTQSVAELRGASDMFRWSVWKQLAYLLLPLFFVFLPLLFAGIAALGRSGAPFVGVMVIALLTFMLGLTLSPTRVRVGVDGVAARWLGRERFIPFSRVTDVRKYTKTSGNKTYVGVEIRLEDGSSEQIVCGQEGWMSGDVEQMLARIREAMELNRRTGGDVAPELLARGTRTLSDWITSLRSIGSGARADLRTAPPPNDVLLRVVEDARKPAPMRVGAAVAAMAGAADAKDRIRVAAGTTASPKLRIALETVAERPDDDDAIAEALGELEAEERATTR